MFKINKTVLFFLLFVFALVIIQFMKDDPTDWRYSFSVRDKIPFGGYILFELMGNFFPDQHIQILEKTKYESYDSLEYSGSNHIIINRSFIPDILDTKEFLHYVAIGNALFISAEQIAGPFADSLQLAMKSDFAFNDTLEVNLSNPVLKNKLPYVFLGGPLLTSFSSFDTSRTVILGNTASGTINFIKVKYHKGEIFLHSEPILFTNYNILKYKNMDYYSKVFSYLPLRNIIWDEYYKITHAEVKSPLRYILNRKPLKWAYFTGLFSILLLFIFGIKRRQRIIPLINPPVNDTVTFVQTIGRLYYQNGDHRNLAVKKIYFFLDYIRSKFFIQTDLSDETFVEKLAAKSGIEKDRIKKLTSDLLSIQKKNKIEAIDLHYIHNQIENFKTEISGTSSI